MAAVAGTKVGTGYVEVQPEFGSNFQDLIEKKLQKSLAPAMKKVGKRSGQDFTKGVGEDIARRAEFAPVLKRFEKLGKDANAAILKGWGAGGRQNSITIDGLDEMSEFFAQARKDAQRTLPAIDRLRSRLRGMAGDFKRTDWRGLGAEIRQLGSKHLRGLGSELRRVGSEFSKTDRRVRTTSSGFGGFDGIMARTNRTAQFFRNTLRLIKWPAFIAGAGLAFQALSALTVGTVATTAALGPLSGALVALPSAALVAAQAFSVLKLATAGVGDAVKAALDAEVKGGTQAIDTMRQQEDAAERVSDAKRNLTSVEEQARVAVDDLREAREGATRQLQDMRLAAEASHDSEQQGRLSLIQARKDLAETLRDPAASGLDIRFAEEAVDQARNDLEATRIEATRAREDYDKAQRAGIEKMPEVVAAKQAEKDANEAVAAANRDLKRAVEDSTEAMQEQGAAASAFHEKMSQLPPAAQKFVRVLVAMKPRLDALRGTAAAGFFPGAEEGLRGSIRNFGVFRGIVDGTSKALGRIASKAGRKLGSEAWGKDLGRLGKLNTRIIDRLGNSTLHLADGFRHILVAAEPFLDWLSESTEKFGEWLNVESKAGRESGKLAEFFDRTRQTMERVWPILKGVGGALLNIGSAADDLGNDILLSLGDAAEGWREWSDSTKGQNTLKRYFSEARPAIFEMGRLIGAAGKAFFELGRQRGVANLLRLVRTELIPALTDLTGTMTAFFSDFLEQFGDLRKEGVPTFEAFLRVLAEHAGEAGWRIAKALVNSFIHAGIWGKVAIGAFILSKFGGLSAVGRLGVRMGGRLGTALMGKFAPTIAAEMAAGSKLGEILSTRMQNLGKAAGRRFAAGVVIGLVTIGYWLGQKIGYSLSEETRAGLRQWGINAGENFVNALIWAINKGIDRINDALDDANLLGKFVDAPEIGRVGRVDFEDGSADDVPKHDFEAARRAHRDHANFIGREAKRGRESFRRQLDLLPEIALRSGRGVNQNILPRLEHLADEGGAKGRKFAGQVGGAFGSLAGTARNAMSNIADNIRESLKALNVGKVPSFNLKKLPHVNNLPSPEQLLGRQRGGPIRGGAPSGDSIPAMLERGEYVLNRRAVEKVGKAKLDAINFGAAPRFQTGGFAELRPAARALAQELAGQGFVPTSTYRPTSTTYHGTGEAIDYGDSVNNMGRLWAVLRPKVARLAELFGPSRLSGATLWKHGSPFSDAGLQAGHEDHIHTAITAMIGPVGSALAKVPRMLLQGPDGPLKRFGQAAIDRVRNAAKAFIDEKAVMSSLGHGPGQAAGSAQLRDWLTTALKLTGHFSPANLEALIGRALQESGGNPRAINLWDSNAQAGTPSKGLLQTIDPTFNAYKMKGLGDIWNPVHNAVAAIRYMFDRYGHIVGPSGSGYTTGGLVEAMQLGGLIGLQGGGPAVGPGKPAKRKYAPMQRHLERFREIGLDPAAGIPEFTKSRILHLAGLSEQAERFSEWASNASALTFEGATGKTVQGVFRGGTEGHWLLEQLNALGSLRNELIAAHQQLAEARERVNKVIEQAKRQLEALRRQIAEGQRERNKLLGNLSDARQALSNAREDKDPKRRESRTAQAQATIAALGERLVQLNFRQDQRRTLATQIKEKSLPVLDERLENVSAAFTGTMEGGEGFIGLKAVQGISGPMNQLAHYGANQPAIGTLGGEILNAQQRLRAIDEEGSISAEDGEKTERQSLLEELLRQANQRTALSEGLFADFRQFTATYGFPKLPTFHSGGILPGPRGQEVPFLGLGGEGVFTEDQMEAIGADGGNAGPLVIEDLTVHRDGRVTGRMYGREFEAEVKRVVQDMAGTGRPVPGGARGF